MDPSTSPATNTSRDAIVEWCRQFLAARLTVPVEEVPTGAGLDLLGVDSVTAAALLIELEDRFRVDVDPEALYDDPTIDAIADLAAAELDSELDTSG